MTKKLKNHSIYANFSESVQWPIFNTPLHGDLNLGHPLLNSSPDMHSWAKGQNSVHTQNKKITCPMFKTFTLQKGQCRDVELEIGLGKTLLKPLQDIFIHFMQTNFMGKTFGNWFFLKMYIHHMLNGKDQIKIE